MSKEKEIYREGKSYSREELESLYREHGHSKSALIKILRFWYEEEENLEVQTSGSTGPPKKIALSRDQILFSAERSNLALGISKTDSIMVCLPLTRVGGIMQVIRALVSDSRIIFLNPSQSPFTRIFCEFREISFEHTSITPSQINDLQAYFKLGRINNSEKPKQIKSVLIGGAPINPAQNSILEKLDVPAWESFGMTETASHIALRKIGRKSEDHFTLLKDAEMKSDHEGRLQILSRATGNQWLLTNDVVEIVGKGKFEWLGRSDFVINSGGIKVHPEYLEDQIRELDHEILRGKNFHISWIPDENYGQSPVLVIEGFEIIENGSNKLLNFIKSNFCKYLNTTKIFNLSTFPTSSGGKIDRLKLAELISSS